MPPDLLPSVSRALVISVCAVAIGRRMLPILLGNASTPWRRYALWALAALPFFSPALVTAYAYARPMLFLSQYSWAEELVYGLLLFGRFFPVALLGIYCLPGNLTPEAWFCANRHRLQRSWRFRWRHLEAGPWVAGLMVFLYAFHEFEMASLWQRPSWTVAVFDAQAQGYRLGETWGLIWGVLLLQLLMIFGAVALVRRRSWQGEASHSGATERRWKGWVLPYLAISALVTAIYPAAFLVAESLPAWRRLFSAFSMERELGQSVMFAFVAATLAYGLASGWVRTSGRPWWLVWGWMVPGLLGSLVLALGLHGLFMWAPLRGMGDAPAPLVTGLTLLILPLMTLILALVSRRETGEAAWLASLSEAPALCWAYFRAPRLAVWALGFTLAFFDVTLPAILAPSSATPVTVRLYNLMHYGHDTLLAAYTLLAVSVPVFLVGLAFALGRWLTWKRDG